MKPKLKVLIVDDSRIFRALVEKILADLPCVEVIGSVYNGRKALEFMQHTVPDLITLDVEMPEMNGIQTLQNIQVFNESTAKDRKVGVLMLSSLTLSGAQFTLEALHLGAFDFITKPSAVTPEENIRILAQELSSKIQAYSDACGFLKVPSSPAAPPVALPVEERDKTPFSETEYKAVLIGASTGGPKALSLMLPMLTTLVKLPIVIVMHMPPLFTKNLAESLGKKCCSKVIECKGNEILRNEMVYIAPGGRHLVLRKYDESEVVTVVNDNPPEEACCPSLNVLFRSAAKAIDGKVIAVILTGMGSDGTNGLGILKRSGAYVIAQDEGSSIIWGMPGSAVKSGNTDRVVPLEGIPEAVLKEIRRKPKRV
jgi:two-component system chemotaxis response regulator CheB